MAASALLRLARQLHLYFGIFIAPAILFFAFTGALQTIGLHETTPGSSYVPPRWAVVIAQIHKKQTAAVNERRPSPPPAPNGAPAPNSPKTPPPAPSAARPATPSTVPLKAFFLVVCLGLFSSTITGIYMSFRYGHDWRILTALLLTGTILPIALVYV